jgi:hypothetical protein
MAWRPTEDVTMTPSENKGRTGWEALPKWRDRSRRNRSIWILTGLVVLVLTLVAFASGCGSGTQASTVSTASTAAAQTGAQTGTSLGAQTGAPSGPPTGASDGTAPGPGATGTRPSGDTTTTSTADTSSSASTTITEAQTTTTTLAEGQYSDGIYLVGTDISSGLYRGAVVGDTGHWEISSDANGDKYVASGDPAGPFYVKVTYGQYLRLTGVVIEKANTTAADPLVTSNITDGTYRVGYDIAAGWYNGTINDGMGYWEVSSDANGTSLVANDYPLGPFTLKVKDGQYLTLRGVTVSQ